MKRVNEEMRIAKTEADLTGFFQVNNRQSWQLAGEEDAEEDAGLADETGQLILE